MSRLVLLLALVALGCAALSGEPTDRAARAKAAADTVRQGVGFTDDACRGYVLYRPYLPAPEPEVDELCRLFVEAQHEPDAGAPEGGP